MLARQIAQSGLKIAEQVRREGPSSQLTITERILTRPEPEFVQDDHSPLPLVQCVEDAPLSTSTPALVTSYRREVCGNVYDVEAMFAAARKHSGDG